MASKRDFRLAKELSASEAKQALGRIQALLYLDLFPSNNFVKSGMYWNPHKEWDQERIREIRHVLYEFRMIPKIVSSED